MTSLVIQLLRKETFCADGIGWSIRERDIFHILIGQLKGKTCIRENDYSSSWKGNERDCCVSGQATVFIPTSLVFPSVSWMVPGTWCNVISRTISYYPRAVRSSNTSSPSIHSGPIWTVDPGHCTFWRKRYGVSILTICIRNTTDSVLLWFLHVISDTVI